MSLKINNKVADCVTYNLNLKGRIGGNNPNGIESTDDYEFYATIVNPIDENQMISIFILKDYDRLIDNNIYPNIDVKVIQHSYREESNDDKFKSINLDKCSISEYYESDNNAFINIGGKPILIQDEGYYTKPLKDDGYKFLLQINEDYYSDELVIEDYPFNFGAIYLYIHQKTKEIIAGYWQFS